MRSYTVPQNSTLTYLMGDHLGSTSLAVNASTGTVIETRYKAWGEVRYTTPNVTLPTRNTFTGQYSYVSDSATDLAASASFGLMFYNARWYDPALGRMAQADTIVPGGVQGLDRYAYVNNSPVNYVDPSGHDVQCTDEGCYETSDAGCNTNIPGADACKTSVVIIICGFAPGDQGVCNNGDAFKDYIKKLRAEGKRVEVYDVDNYSGAQKDDASNDILEFIEGVLRDIPQAKFTIIGHSAGADAAILLGYKAVKAGIGNSISGVGLLDPTLTAGPYNTDNGDLKDELLGILDAGIRVFVGDGIDPGSDEYLSDGVTKYADTQPFLNPLNTDLAKYIPSLYLYQSYSGMYHMALPTDPGVISAMDSFLFP
jgi:RHS repeat-associated protein